MATGTITIVNELGLHARAAAKFIQLAKSFPCTVQLGPDEESLVNGKSITHVLTLAAGVGTNLVLSTEGEEADQAFSELSELVASRFGEDE